MEGCLGHGEEVNAGSYTGAKAKTTKREASFMSNWVSDFSHAWSGRVVGLVQCQMKHSRQSGGGQYARP